MLKMSDKISKINLKKIESIFGKDNIIFDRNELLAYSTDASMEKGNALLVVFPKTNEQVRKLARLAIIDKLNLVSRGYGTNTQGWAVPNNSIVVDFSRMRRIIELNKRDKTVIAEPGVTVKELNDALKLFGFYFPIIPLFPSVKTIGGMVAENAVGYRAEKYGTIYNWVAEAEVVDGSGKLYKFKGKKELFGSYGHLGMITRLKLKLTKPPQLSSMDFYVFERISDLLTVVEDFTGMIGVISMEYINPSASKQIGFEGMHTLIVEYDDEIGKITDVEKMSSILDKHDILPKALMSAKFIHIRNIRVPISKTKEILSWLDKNNIPHFGMPGFGDYYCGFSKDKFSLIPKLESFLNQLKQSSEKQDKMSKQSKYAMPKRSIGKTERIKILKDKYDPYNVLHYKDIKLL